MARSFNGSSDKIADTISLNTKPISVAAWVNVSSSQSGSGAIVSANAIDTFHFKTTQADGGTLGLAVDAQSIVNVGGASGNYFPVNTWAHVGFTYDSSGNYVFYINGLNSGSGTNNVTFSSSAAWIGKAYNGENTNGNLAEIGIWNAILTANEYLSLAQGNLPSQVWPTFLQAYWPLYGLSGTNPEPDLSGHCLTADTRCFFGSGYRAVRNIDPASSETILQNDGKQGNILNYWKRPYSGPVVRFKARGTEPIGLTPDHLVLRVAAAEIKTRRGRAHKLRGEIDTSDLPSRWVPAKELAVDDYLLIPKPSSEVKEATLEFESPERRNAKLRTMEAFAAGAKPKELFGKYGVPDDTIYRYHAMRKHSDYKKPHRRNLAGKSFVLNEDWAEIFGWWVAEGSVGRRANGVPERVVFSLGSTETEEAKRLGELLVACAGSVAMTQKGSALRIVTPSVPLASFLIEEFGAGSHHKRIPNWIRTASPEIIRAFMRGYIGGDGYISKLKKRHKTTVEIATVSDSLVEGVYQLWMRLGVLPMISQGSNGKYHSEINGKKINSGPSWVVRVSGRDVRSVYPNIPVSDSGKDTYLQDDSFFYVRIGKITTEQYSGDVYDFETVTHSLGLPVIIHNSNNGTLTGTAYANHPPVQILALGQSGTLYAPSGVADVLYPQSWF